MQTREASANFRGRRPPCRTPRRWKSQTSARGRRRRWWRQNERKRRRRTIQIRCLRDFLFPEEAHTRPVRGFPEESKHMRWRIWRFVRFLDGAWPSASTWNSASTFEPVVYSSAPGSLPSIEGDTAVPLVVHNVLLVQLIALKFHCHCPLTLPPNFFLVLLGICID